MKNKKELKSIQKDLQKCMFFFDNQNKLDDINERLKDLIKENR